MSEIALSEIFEIGINIYEQKEDGMTSLIYRSLKQDKIMYLNLHENHFSYVIDFSKYSRSYRCSSCGKIWSHHGNFKRHINVCDVSTKEVFCNEVYTPPKSVFELLEAHNIIIPEQLRFYEYRICFDIECTLARETNIPNSDQVTYAFKHVLASISVCSNVDGYTEPECLISDGCPKKLVKTFIQHMLEIAAVAYDLQREKYSEFIPQIDELEAEALQEKWDQYMMQIPVLSYNGLFLIYTHIQKEDISALKRPAIAMY